MPIQLLMFDDRIEIRNPGGLYGRMTVDQLGKVQPDTRNPVLVNILEVLKVTENRYSGIPTIKRTMREHGLSEPEFKVERGTFVTVLYNSNRQEKYIELINNIHSKEKGDAFVQATFGAGKSLNSIAQFNAQFRLLQFLEVERTRKEIAEFVGMDSVSYALKKYIE